MHAWMYTIVILAFLCMCINFIQYVYFWGKLDTRLLFLSFDNSDVCNIPIYRYKIHYRESDIKIFTS